MTAAVLRQRGGSGRRFLDCVRFSGRAPQHPRVGVNECQVLTLRGGHLGLHWSYHERKDPLYDIATQLCAIGSSAIQGVHENTAMARSTRTRAKAAGVKPRRAPSTRKSGPSTPWPTIEEFLDAEQGTISLGAINDASLGCAAVASDEHNMLVALVRSRRETLHQLLDRLEKALRPAIEEQIYVDEING